MAARGAPGVGAAAASQQQASHTTSASASAPLESIQRILEQAKQVARFSSLMRTSPLSFQAFLERPDFRCNEAAKEASMHIAVVSVDLGMADGMRVLVHADKARSCILTMCT